jgi:dihydrofolate reductase
MRLLNAFNFLSLNGFYKGPNGDIGWHRHGEEESEFSREGAGSGSTLLFGRVTYEMMAGFWPSEQAKQMDAVVAAGMNATEKIVFSRTLKKAEWNNTRIVSGDIIAEVRKMKQGAGPGMTILGSGSIITQFAAAGLIDQFQFMIDAVAIGGGTPMLQGIPVPIKFKLTGTRTFKSGSVLLTYVPET